MGTKELTPVLDSRNMKDFLPWLKGMEELEVECGEEMMQAQGCKKF